MRLFSFFSSAAALLVLLFASSPNSVSADPNSSGFLLLASDSFGPQVPSAGSPVVTHSTSFSQDFDGLHPGRMTKLDYTVEHSDNVWLLDVDQRVDQISCTTDDLTIQLADDQAAQSFLDQMVIGGTTLVGHCVRSDGSYGDQGDEVVFARQIMSVQQPQPTLVTLSTQMVDSSSVYKHANVSFSTNSYGMFSSDNNRCSIWDILRHRCSAVVNETKEWADLFHYDYSGQTIWSGSVGTNPKVEADFVCSSCYAKLTPELIFNLQITNNKLANVEVLIQGNFESEVVATVTATGAFSQANSAIPVYTINVPDIVFYVGAFPIHVRFSVPITASYEVSLNAEATASAGIHLNGDMGAGFGYDSGTWGPRFVEGYGYNMIAPTGPAHANALVKVGLTPSFRLGLDLVLSGQVDVSPYVELNVEASTIENANVASPSVQGQLYAGVDVEVAGTLGVTFHDHNVGPHMSFGPKDVFSYRKQLWSGSYPPQQRHPKRPAPKRIISA